MKYLRLVSVEILSRHWQVAPRLLTKLPVRSKAAKKSVSPTTVWNLNMRIEQGIQRLSILEGKQC